MILKVGWVSICAHSDNLFNYQISQCILKVTYRTVSLINYSMNLIKIKRPITKLNIYVMIFVMLFVSGA